MADRSLTEEEQVRIKKAGEEIVAKLSPPRAAAELGVAPMELLLVLQGTKPVTPELAEKIAKAKGVSLEQLAAGPVVERFPNRVEAIAIARKEGYAEEAIREIHTRAVDKDLSLVDWILALRKAQDRHGTTSPAASTNVVATSTPASSAASLGTDTAVGALPSPTSAAASHGGVAQPGMLAELAPVEVAVARAPEPAMQTIGSGSGIPGIQGEQTGILMAIATNQAALSLNEYASLSMGLELLPHRRDDVFNHFGLRSEVARENELHAWSAHFEAHPREKREWETARQHSRHFWYRFDKPETAGQLPPLPPVVPPAVSQPAPPPPGHFDSRISFAASPTSEPGTPLPVTLPSAVPRRDLANPTEVYEPIVVPAVVGGGGTDIYEPIIAAPPNAAAHTQLPALSLEAYARISAEVHFAPQRAEEVFARHGLGHAPTRQAVNDAWQERLRTNPGDQWEWQRLYTLRLTALEQAARPAAPPPSSGLSSPYTRIATPPPMALKVYAQMTVELEKKPQDRQKILARFGLLDAEKRRVVDEYWHTHLSDPTLRVEWQKTIDRIRKTWMDL